MKIKEALMNSPLRGLISDAEIHEIAEEIGEEIENLIENEVEKSCENLQDEIEYLKEEIDSLESEKKLESEYKILDGSLRRVMLMEWIEENISILEQLYFQDLDLKKLLLSKSSHTRIVLVGRAASGKDHSRKILEKRGFKYAVSYTTRPPREDETEGKDYFFLSEEKFKEMIDCGFFYEYVTFNGWYYGTTKEQFYRDDVFIMTPHGISCIDAKDRANTVILFFDIPYEVRKERLMQRCDADTVDRRLEADDRDFSNFSDYDIKITDSNF